MIFGLLAAFIGPQFFAELGPGGRDAGRARRVRRRVLRPTAGRCPVRHRRGPDRPAQRDAVVGRARWPSPRWSSGCCRRTSRSGSGPAVLLLVCRLLQGLSTGIEAPLSTAYAIEVMPEGYEGRAAGYISFFVNFGILLASLVSFATSYFIGGDAMSTWGWRVPLLFGAALSFFVLYLRRALPETLARGGAARRPPPARGAGAQALARPDCDHLRGRRRPGLQLRVERRAAEPGPRLASARTRRASSASPRSSASSCCVGAIVTGRVADRVRLSRAFLVTRLAAVPGVFLMLLYAGPGPRHVRRGPARRRRPARRRT